MICPKCQTSEMFYEPDSKYWNGGKTSTGKDKPIWKCKNKGVCDGVIWAPKGQAQPVGNHPVAFAPGPVAAGPIASSSPKLQDVFDCYDKCLVEALEMADRHAERVPKEVAARLDVNAMASTMMIQWYKLQGVR